LLADIAVSSGRLSQISKLNEWLPKEPVALEWFRLRFAAAVGDYTAADDALLKIARRCERSPHVSRSLRDAHVLAWPPGQPPPSLSEQEGLGLLIGKAVLDATQPASAHFLIRLNTVRGDEGLAASTLWLDRTSEERVIMLRSFSAPCMGPRIDK